MYGLMLVSAFFTYVFAHEDLLVQINNDEDVIINECPYQLGLEVDGLFRCGASLIKENVALTAAQCTKGKKEEQLLIRAGTSLQGTGGVIANVIKICQHPQYNTLSFDYDVSVLLLSRSFSPSRLIKKIKLQAAEVEVPPGSPSVVTGWGTAAKPGSELQKIKVVKITDEVCEDKYRGINVTDRMSCYRTYDGNCNGDYGGPVVADDRQLGIVSWGAKGVCGSFDYPGVYTDVTNLEIVKHIDTCMASLPETF